MPQQGTNKNSKILFSVGDSIDIAKEKTVKTLYQDFVSVANQIFYSKMNLLIELRSGWSELKNITLLRNDFL